MRGNEIFVEMRQGRQLPEWIQIVKYSWNHEVNPLFVLYHYMQQVHSI